MTHEEKAKLLKGQDWGDIRATLFAFALSRAKSPARANDLAQEAILIIHDTRREPWDPARYPDLKKYLVGVVRQLLNHDWKSARRHRELQMDLEDGDQDNDSNENGTSERRDVAEHPGPNPEEVTTSRALLARRTKLLRARLAKDQLALAILDLFLTGVTKPQDQRDELGVEMKDIQNARKRFFAQAEAVARDIPTGAYDDDAVAGGRDEEEVLQ